VSPERLAVDGFRQFLAELGVKRFAIDEAHCISEWGHEFRPEYRQLSSLRQNFPDKPIAAFTASATKRVRKDILDQLRLRDPHKYIASFRRHNLRYVVHQCDKDTYRGLLLSAARAYDGESIIVYAPTIAGVEDTVEFLEKHGIAAIPYHGQMDNAERRRNQEHWMNDEVRVLVGTIAFGLGINKPAVRAVIHTSMPKSIEQYYQEAGRAGRDGKPADCVLLWRKKDIGLLVYFIQQLQDPDEASRAWQRYHEVTRFVTGDRCRHQPARVAERAARIARRGEEAQAEGAGAGDAPTAARRTRARRRIQTVAPPHSGERIRAGLHRAQRRRARGPVPQAPLEPARTVGSQRHRRKEGGNVRGGNLRHPGTMAQRGRRRPRRP
jgi:RecQ family ATP-dependent DNA helicase